MEVLTSVPPLEKLAAALVKAQLAMINPPKTKTAHVGKYSYRYVDLAEIIDHVRQPLGKNGLSVVQRVQSEPDRNLLVTTLLHESGQSLESTYPLPAKVGAQEMGSAITYARRYSLCAILGIAADEDDDGSKAETAGAAEPPAEKKARDELIERMGAASLGNLAVMRYAKAKSLGDGRTVEDLSLDAVHLLLSEWDKVVAEIKAGAAPPADAQRARPSPPPASAPPDLSGIAPDLAELMRQDGVTPDQLKAYYTAAGHLPASVEPAKLPATYVKALVAPANWAKALAKMKEAA
jgi:hypothetical protein